MSRLDLSLAVIVLFTASPAVAQLSDAGFEGPYNQLVDPQSTTISGFVASGWSHNIYYGDLNAVYSQDTTNPHSGASCQKIDITAVRSGSLQLTQNIAGQAGHLYTAGLWLRGTPGTRVFVRLSLDGPPYTAFGDIPVYLTTAWQFVSIPAHITGNLPLLFMIDADAPTTFYIDDASLGDVLGPVTPKLASQLTLTDFGMHINNYLASKGPFNLNLEGVFNPVSTTLSTITGLIGQYWFDNSDWAKLTVDYQPNTASPHGGKSAQRVTVAQITTGQVQTAQFAGLRYGQAYSASAWLRASPGMTVGFGIRQWGSPYTFYGYQSLTGDGAWHQVTVTGTVSQAGATVLMVVAQSPGTLDFDDIVLTDASGSAPQVGQPWPATRFGTWRTWDQAGTTWAALEPQKGVWDFTLLDQAVEDAQAHNTQILYTMGQTPLWASARPGDTNYYGAGAAAEPADINDWIAYVTMVATRYRGRITRYEIWNEPNDPFFFSGDLAAMLKLSQTAYQTLKQIDSNIVVTSPAPYAVGYLQSFLGAGGGQYIDVVGYHIYDYAGLPEDDARVLADLRTVIQRANVSAKPLSITEGAVGDLTTSDETLNAGLLARKYLVQYLYGASSYNWYTWGTATSFCLATTQADGVTLTKAGAALGYLEGWLTGSGNRMQSFGIDGGGNWAVRLRAASGAVSYIVWNPTSASTWTRPLGFRPMQQLDLFGGVTSVAGVTNITTSTQPVLILGR